MEEAYRVHVTEQAQEQLGVIVRYIAFDLKAPEAARHFLDAFETGAGSLSQFPKRCALTEEEPWHSLGVRKLPVQNFLAYFWIDENAALVHIFALIYGRRDQGKALANSQMQ